MSIDSTKSVSTIAATLNCDLINAQQKQPTAQVKSKPCIEPSTNVSLNQTVSLLSSTNDINMEKVNKIKHAIETGSLLVNTDKIADELIRHTMEYLTMEMDIEGE
ncbi:flagellar biosynthesis anti-sigma factor FlgM [Frischella perrara]|uniref:Negative regulator of flagellin synthesis n=1 Tax=Frischella perrara TaxID=1267021 RepID=A0A318N0H9_FRIPE|nr:flagellar biosynthesis anti-sigma factor FlgM [Frischella perrara]PXY94364.1 flagellar biosynthesis anti-sigma factor FlgM [Frischella perrara]